MPPVTKKTNKQTAIAKASKRGIGDLEGQAWKKVKIKGKVIADDGVGFEGLIGLEVLQDYNPVLVTNPKKRKSGEQRINASTKTKKRKNTPSENDEADEIDIDDIVSGSDEEEEEEQVVLAQKQKTRKERLAERAAAKQEKRKEKRERRKQLRQSSQDKKNAKNSGDRFALLRPPPQEEEPKIVQEGENDEAPMLVPAGGGLDIDDLEGWNGLGVPNPILRAIAESGFKSPTEIQTLTLPPAIFGKKDILGAAETGSGKTLAFGIPMLAGIMELKSKNASGGIRKPPKRTQATEDDTNPNLSDHELTPPPEELDTFSDLESERDSDGEEAEDDGAPLYALVLTPTRELAVQVRDHLITAAKYTDIKVAAIFGGLSVAKQERLLRRCPEIVVATPGRLWELYQQENRHLSKMEDISFLVIDETDRMVEKGHFEELRSILKVLNADEAKKRARQNFVFSATLTLVHELPEYLQKRNKGRNPKFFKQTPGMKLQSLIEELGISQPKIVDITRTQQTAQKLTECRLICPIDEKDYYLYYFLQRHPGRTIVFCNSIDCVKRLATLFGLLDCQPLPLHANMIQKQRLKNLERFRDNPNGLLIATDVAARGLDIPNVEHVIHYQVPRTSENYVHRSGRTARANKDGITVMFMEPGEVKSYVKLYRNLDKTEDLPLFPVMERYLSAVRDRVNLAREVDKQELKMRRTQTEKGWMKKHAEEMDMIIEGFNDASDQDDEDPFVIEKRRNRMHLEATRAKLRTLLSTPIFPKGFSFKYPTSTDSMTTTIGNEPNSAVKVMKDAIEDMKLAKKMRNKRKKITAN